MAHHCMAQLKTTLLSWHCAALHSMAQHTTAWYSTAQHSTAQCSIPWHGMAQHGTAWNSMAQEVLAWHRMAQHGIAWHSTAQHSTAQHSTAQRTMAWHKAMFPCNGLATVDDYIPTTLSYNCKLLRTFSTDYKTSSTVLNPTSRFILVETSYSVIKQLMKVKNYKKMKGTINKYVRPSLEHIRQSREHYLNGKNQYI